MASLDGLQAFGEVRRAHTTAGGDALSTTAILIPFLPGTEYVVIYPRNFATAVVAKVALVPWLTVLLTSDTLASVTDDSDDAQDGSTSTDVVLSSLPTFANGGFLLVGAHVPIRGARVDVDAANATVSVLTVKYWNGAWTTTGATDGTTSGGATMAVDGDVTWTVPTDWVKATLVAINSPTPGSIGNARNTPLYWTRWEVSVALDSSTTLNSLVALARSTAYAELASGVALSTKISRVSGGHAAVEALTDVGTASLIVDCYTAQENSFD